MSDYQIIFVKGHAFLYSQEEWINSNIPKGWGKAILYAKDEKEVEEALEAIKSRNLLSPLVKVLESPSPELERKIDRRKTFKQWLRFAISAGLTVVILYWLMTF